jgi:hypothetical protein
VGAGVLLLQGLIDGSDAWPASKRGELVGSLRDKPGLRRYLRRTRAGLCGLGTAERWFLDGGLLSVLTRRGRLRVESIDGREAATLG